MLSVSEMRARGALLQSLGDRQPVGLCHIDMRQMPLVIVGEDALQYIPFGLHPDISTLPLLVVRRLRELMLQYMVEGITVSAHTLPKQDTQTHTMMQALRASQPNLSGHLLHHWCADEHGGRLLRRFLQENWQKAWNIAVDRSELPANEVRLLWLAAVNMLMVRLLREGIKQLPDEHADMLDMVLVQVLGASFHWLLHEFSEHQINVNDAQRLQVVQALAIPVPALAFFRNQPRGRIFSDAAHMVVAYGMETELLPCLRQMFSTESQMTARQVLDGLAADHLGDHLLQRSWARLSLRDIGEKTGQGMWVKWALDARRLDKLLSSPEQVASEFSDALQLVADHPFAAWLLAHGDKGLFGKSRSDATPWREDETTVQAFLLFEEDAKLERERRISEQRWLNRETELIGEGRGSEAGRILGEAHAKGNIVLLQKDTKVPLMRGVGGCVAQACLRVEWSEYLRIVERRSGPGMGEFLDVVFQPGIVQLLNHQDGIFMDGYSASGLLLRGNAAALLLIALALREVLFSWLQELDVLELGVRENGASVDDPVVCMCLAAGGEWSMSGNKGNALNGNLLKGKLAFSPGFAQAESAVSRNDGLERLLRSIDERSGRKPLGSVRVDALKMADGKSVPILCNRGFVITGTALKGLSQSARQWHLQRFSVSTAQLGQQLSAYHLPGGKLEGVSAQLGEEAKVDTNVLLMVNVGKVLLAGSVEDVFEVLDTGNPVHTLISAALPGWQALEKS